VATKYVQTALLGLQKRQYLMQLMQQTLVLSLMQKNSRPVALFAVW
jgi:hypothetical protein